MGLILSFFRLPFWVFLGGAAGLFYLGELSHRDTSAKNQELARALTGPPPAAVNLAAFDPARDIGAGDEITVQGVINPVHEQVLTKQGPIGETTRHLYVLFDVADEAGTREARAAMVLNEAEQAQFLNGYLSAHTEIVTDEAGSASVVTLNGQVVPRPDLSALVEEAFVAQGLTKSANFIYVAPFLEGRAAGLTPTVSAEGMRDLIRSAGIAAALIGVLKMAMRRRRKAKAAPEEAVATAEAPAPMVASVEGGDYERVDAIDDVAEDVTPEPKKPILPRVLAVALLAGLAVYSGYGLYAAMAAGVVLAVLALRWIGKALGGGLGRLGVPVPGGAKSEEAVMASVQTALEEGAPATPEVEPDTEEYAAVMTSVEVAAAPRPEAEPVAEEMPDLTHNDDIMARLMSNIQVAPEETPEADSSAEMSEEAAERSEAQDVQVVETAVEHTAEFDPVAAESPQPDTEQPDIDLSRDALEETKDEDEEYPVTEMHPPTQTVVKTAPRTTKTLPPVPDYFDLEEGDAPEVMADQDQPVAAREQVAKADESEETPRRRFRLPLPKLGFGAKEGAVAPREEQPEAEHERAEPKRGRRFALPKLAFGSKTAQDEDTPALSEVPVPREAAVETPKRGIKLALPFLNRKSDAPADAPETETMDMADGTSGISGDATEGTPKRGFKLRLPSLAGRGRKVADEAEDAVDTPVMMEAEAPVAEAPPKRGFKLSLPMLGRKSNDEAEAPVIAEETAEEAPERGFGLSLLGRKAKAEGDQAAAPTVTAKPRKEALQSATCLVPNAAEAPQGLAARLQLMMARLAPAERAPKAFADLPDPFDRLAAEVQRSGAS